MRRSLASLFWALALGATACPSRAPKPATPTQPTAPPDAGVAARDAGPAVAPTTVIEMKAVVAVSLPKDAICSHAPGKADPALPGKCRRDADCTEHAYGRCNAVSPHGRGRELDDCVYDECVADSECETQQPGTICFCASGAGSSGNRCQRGNCRNDAECAPGEKCAFENAYVGSRRLDGRYCTTRKDACHPGDDADCGQRACAYSTAARRWECTPGSIRGLTD